MTHLKFLSAKSPRLHIHAATLLIVLMLGAGCGGLRSTSTPEPVRVSFRLAGASDLNGGGNAAFVHIYQLTDNAALRNALPESFWQSPDQILADAVLNSRQVQLFPGSEESLTIDLLPGARFVGVAANLRAPDRDRWRTFILAEEAAGRVVNVTVDTNSLSAELR